MMQSHAFPGGDAMTEIEQMRGQTDRQIDRQTDSQDRSREREYRERGERERSHRETTDAYLTL